MICPYCKTIIRDDSRFCRKCGKNLEVINKLSDDSCTNELVSNTPSPDLSKNQKIRSNTVSKKGQNKSVFGAIRSILYLLLILIVSGTARVCFSNHNTSGRNENLKSKYYANNKKTEENLEAQLKFAAEKIDKMTPIKLSENMTVTSCRLNNKSMVYTATYTSINTDEITDDFLNDNKKLILNMICSKMTDSQRKLFLAMKKAGYNYIYDYKDISGMYILT